MIPEPAPGTRCFWFTGLPAAGKTTRAQSLRAHLGGILLDGDEIRAGLSADLGFGQADRYLNVCRVAETAKLVMASGFHTFVAMVSPLEEQRESARQIIGASRFCLIYVDTPIDVCRKRDPKGLYARSRRGELPGLTGVDSPFEVPQAPHMVAPSTLTHQDFMVRLHQTFKLL